MENKAKERMTVHRGLAELKLVMDRLSYAALTGTYCMANKRSNKKINGCTVDEARARIQSDYDSATSLIKRRNKIKTAIVKSNAETIVKVAGEDMTVAEAIERKTSIRYDKELLKCLESGYKNAVATVNKHNDGLSVKLEEHLKNQTGGRDKVDTIVVEQLTKIFMDMHEYELIDPLNLDKKIKELRAYIENFETEVDAVLSESNATTFIEID